MQGLLKALSVFHAVLAALFALASVALVVVAVILGWNAFADGLTRSGAQGIIEIIGLLAAAVVALQIAQTIAEEEVVRKAHVSGPTRVRRFLSRFLVVVVVALAVEGLVATFRASQHDGGNLLHVAVYIFSVGVLLAGWGVFVYLNRSAEELEPEAMHEAKKEDRKLKQG
jgi:hypothetical protein